MSEFKLSGLGGVYYDYMDESTHVTVNGERFARPKMGEGELVGPLSQDDKGRWCLAPKKSAP